MGCSDSFGGGPRRRGGCGGHGGGGATRVRFPRGGVVATMADRGRMKGVEGGEGGSGAGEGAEGRDGEAREELELALSLGRRGWHLPAARREPPPPPAAMRWTMPPHSWDHDAAGSSRAATHVPPLRCRDIWHGDNDAGGAIEGAEEGDEEDEEGDEDGDRDLQSKRPKVRGFGE